MHSLASSCFTCLMMRSVSRWLFEFTWTCFSTSLTLVTLVSHSQLLRYYGGSLHIFGDFGVSFIATVAGLYTRRGSWWRRKVGFTRRTMWMSLVCCIFSIRNKLLWRRSCSYNKPGPRRKGWKGFMKHVRERRDGGGDRTVRGRRSEVVEN